MKKLFLVLCVSLLNLYSSEENNNNLEIAKWSEFIETLYRMTEGKEIKPFFPVDTLVGKYLCQIESENPVLDIGDEEYHFGNSLKTQLSLFPVS